jgi:membrane protein DedA with SNARE-associated domain
MDSARSLLIEYRYWVLVPLAIVEGPGVAFIAGTLAALAYFNPYLVYGLFVVKDGLVDGGFYILGRRARGSRLLTLVLERARVTTAQVAHVRRRWTEHPWRTMCVAKLSWGLSPALLAVAGIVEMPVASFLSRAVGVAAVQYALLIALGYYFGHAIHAVSVAMRLVGYALAAVVIIAIVYGRRRVRAEAESADRPAGHHRVR